MILLLSLLRLLMAKTTSPQIIEQLSRCEHAEDVLQCTGHCYHTVITLLQIYHSFLRKKKIKNTNSEWNQVNIEKMIMIRKYKTKQFYKEKKSKTHKVKMKQPLKTHQPHFQLLNIVYSCGCSDYMSLCPERKLWTFINQILHK